MNHYPWWKSLIILLVVVVGIVYALPNIYGMDAAIQITDREGEVPNQLLVQQLQQLLDKQDIEVLGTEIDDYGLAIRLQHANQQLAAQEIVQQQLGDDWLVALHRISAAPDWLRSLGANPVALGLDLRGGVRFLLEIDLQGAQQQRLETITNGLRGLLREEGIRNRGLRLSSEGQMVALFDDQDAQQQAARLISEQYPELLVMQSNQGNRYTLTATLDEAATQGILDYAVEQSIITLRNRVDELGVAEAAVVRQGSQRIAVELPGVQDTTRAKEIIGQTAQIEFLLQDLQATQAGTTPPGSRVVYDESGMRYVFQPEVVLSGDSIVSAQAGIDAQSGQPNVSLRVGGNVTRFNQITGQNVGRPMGSIYIETRFEDQLVAGEWVRVPVRSEQVINAATIQSALGSSFQITGMGSAQAANNLALLLRAGSLPAPVDIVEERTVGPSLGADNIAKGTASVAIGLALVLLCMAFYYSQFGIIANIALVCNLILLVALLSLLGAVLTLPGIAGIVLTVGMAVDANVLIFERIREELRQKAGVQAAISAGYDKAFVTIVDANITTFVVALVLFTLGSGPIKGFAITLSLGLITSVFTAVTFSRMLVNWCYGGRDMKKLPIGMKG